MRSWGTDLVASIRDALEPAADPSRAGPMAAYMRHQFAFLGVPTPRRRALVRDVTRSAGRPSEAELVAAVRALWALDAREYQYAACDVLARFERVCGAPFLVAGAEPLIVTKSWWDTVDALRPAIVGPLVSRHHELVDVLWRWVDSDDVWLVRSAITHQLGYGGATDEALLFAFCDRRADHPYFFVRKAIGWALREHAKRSPDAVRAFVAARRDRLSLLSTREALARIGTG